MKEKTNQKLYIKWWFWVIIGFMFCCTIFNFFNTCNEVYLSYEEIENQLMECQELVDEWDDWWERYEDAMYEYCELDPTNLLCEEYQ